MKNNEDELLIADEDLQNGESLGLSPEKRKVFTNKGNPEIASLHRKFKQGILILQPDFQRGFVWDIKKASRLIESVLLDIPLPVVYLSEGKGEEEYVIDGQQRLTSFFSFIDGKFSNHKGFELTGLNALTELEGKSFKELSRKLQNKILYHEISTITFRKESNESLKFEVFERLNSGSVSLNDQELRNCIYRGTYNDLIKGLANDTTFRKLIGMKGQEKRMRDVEFVLRFCAFYRNGYQNYKPSMKNFLNQEMEKHRDLDQKDISELRKVFKRAVSHVNSLLGENAFKRFYRGDEGKVNGYWEPKQMNASLYDILMDSLSRVNSNIFMRNLDAIREAYIDLMTGDDDFIRSIELSTSSRQAINKRFIAWNQALNSILSKDVKQDRCFTAKLKSQLFRANPTCAICEQKIMAIDDAAVDHIKQYWQGGLTIPSNARLTHRYCNMARARKEGYTPVQTPEKKKSKPVSSSPQGNTKSGRGCTVDGVHYTSGREAIIALIDQGKIEKSALQKSSYNAHHWLHINAAKYRYAYVRDGK